LRIEVGLAGVGGQGVLVAGSIIGKAAVLDGLYAAQSVSYGAEVRGTLSLSEVVVSDTPILYPFSSRLDALALMSVRAAKATRRLKRGGVLVADEEAFDLSYAESYKVLSVPAFKLAREKLGRPLLGNLVLVGALAKELGLPSLKSLERAVVEELPEARARVGREAAVEALRLGWGFSPPDKKKKGS